MAKRERLAALIARAGLARGALQLRRAVGDPVITILTYHHIAEPTDGDGFDPGVADATPAQFERHLALLAAHGTCIGLDELCAAFRGAALPPNPFVITFDDGYRSNLEVAVPLLQRHGLRAAFFIATQYVSERRLFWWETLAQLRHRASHPVVDLTYPRAEQVDLREPGALRRLARLVKNTPGLDLARFLAHVADAAGVSWTRDDERQLCDQLIMTWDQVRALRAAGMDIGSHSHTHRVLETLSAEDARADLKASQAALTRELGHPAKVLAYPVGRSLMPHLAHRAAVADAGFELALTNASGVNRMWPRPRDRFDVGRLATDRDLSDALFVAQWAMPLLANRSHPPS